METLKTWCYIGLFALFIVTMVVIATVASPFIRLANDH